MQTGIKGHRRHDSDWARAAGTDYRRPADGEDGDLRWTPSSTRRAATLICIYVAIGQKRSTVAQRGEDAGRLRRHGVHHRGVRVGVGPGPHAIYRAVLGLLHRRVLSRRKRHACASTNDLSKHAASYREISLLLRRPPGREAYPGDVFYLHSRLLERAAKLSDENGGGSLTALPFIENQAATFRRTSRPT